MKKLNSGLVILRQESNRKLGIDVALTRKTLKSGIIRHGVVITDKRSGNRIRLRTPSGIGGAWKIYKGMMIG